MDLIALYNDPDANSATKFAEVTGDIDIDELLNGYQDLLALAPSRHERGKLYLTGRSGITSSGETSNRREEHLAVALYNASQAAGGLALSDGRSLEILTYQMPLKARQSDAGIGKVDLFAIIGGHIPSVIELKVAGRGNALGDTPLRALIEGFAYCALVEANMAHIFNIGGLLSFKDFHV